MFYKRDNFCDFQFTYFPAHKAASKKGSTLIGKNLPKSRKKLTRVYQFPFKYRRVGEGGGGGVGGKGNIVC